MQRARGRLPVEECGALTGEPVVEGRAGLARLEIRKLFGLVMWDPVMVILVGKRV